MTDDNHDENTGAVVSSTIEVPQDLAVALLGSADVNLRMLETQLPADIHVRGNRITLSGAVADVAASERVVSELIRVVGAALCSRPTWCDRVCRSSPQSSQRLQLTS